MNSSDLEDTAYSKNPSHPLSSSITKKTDGKKFPAEVARKDEFAGRFTIPCEKTKTSLTTHTNEVVHKDKSSAGEKHSNTLPTRSSSSGVYKRNLGLARPIVWKRIKSQYQQGSKDDMQQFSLLKCNNGVDSYIYSLNSDSHSNQLCDLRPLAGRCERRRKGGFCGKLTIFRCRRCGEAYYCSRSCQLASWHRHQDVCVNSVSPFASLFDNLGAAKVKKKKGTWFQILQTRYAGEVCVCVCMSSSSTTSYKGIIQTVNQTSSKQGEEEDFKVERWDEIDDTTTTFYPASQPSLSKSSMETVSLFEMRDLYTMRSGGWDGASHAADKSQYGNRSNCPSLSGSTCSEEIPELIDNNLCLDVNANIDNPDSWDTCKEGGLNADGLEGVTDDYDGYGCSNVYSHQGKRKQRDKVWGDGNDDIDMERNRKMEWGGNGTVDVPMRLQNLWNLAPRFNVDLLDRQYLISFHDITTTKYLSDDQTDDTTPTTISDHWSLGSSSHASSPTLVQVSTLVSVTQASFSDLTTEILVLPYRNSEWQAKGFVKFTDEIDVFRIEIHAEDIGMLGVSSDASPENLLKLCHLVLDLDRLHLEIRRQEDNVVCARSGSIRLTRSSSSSLDTCATTIKPSFASIADEAIMQQDEEKVATLISILPHLTRATALKALHASFGDIERAAEMVLSSVDEDIPSWIY